MIYAHLHWFLAAAIVLFSLSIGRARVVYLSLQVSLWIIGLSIWDYTNNSFDPWPQIPCGCLLLLLALYKPIVFLLNKMMRPRPAVQRPQVKDEQFEGYEVQVQRHTNED